MILKLPLTADPERDQRHRWLNTDQILWFEGVAGVDGVARMMLTTGDTLDVQMEPHDLAELLDPDHNCLEGGPEHCGYDAYLGSTRRDESPDLSHTAYHAAMTAASEHMAECKGYATRGYCHICVGHENLLRK